MNKRVKLVVEKSNHGNYIYVYVNDEYVNMFSSAEIKQENEIIAIYKQGIYVTGFGYERTEIETISYRQ